MRTPVKTKHKKWKEKAVERGERLRRLSQELKRQKARAEKWRVRYYEDRSSNRLTPVSSHKYSLELIWLAVLMNIQFNLSLRGVSRSIAKLGLLYGKQINYISHNTIRNWSLKVGLYFLLQKIEKGKYVIICDESVEIGREHLMLILVVPIEKFSPIMPLQMEDVKVLDFSVQQSWKGSEVSTMIKKKVAKYDLDLVYGISDKDHVLRKAYKDCNITWVGDCTHEMANQTKAIFTKDEIFNGFIKKLNALRAKWIMSKNNYYVPPGLRAKTRFHQLFIVHKWAQNILDDWPNIPVSVQEELAFVLKNKELIKTMETFHYFITEFARLFKSKGIQQNTRDSWNRLIDQYRKEKPLSGRVEIFLQKMNDYLDRQQASLPNVEQIICCSDIIESMFGKYKNKGGAKIITDDVLKIAAFPEDIQQAQVMKAMQQVKTREVLNWKKNNTTVSKLALLKKNKKNKKKSAA